MDNSTNTPNMSGDRRPYFDLLDILRFIAFLVVFISHAALFLGYNAVWFDVFKYKYLVYGDFAVQSFFVLSAFLITYMLMREFGASGKIRIGYFYARRILRIWPLYFLAIILGIGAFYLVGSMGAVGSSGATGIGQTFSCLWKYFTFIGNYCMVNDGANQILPLAVLWSISVEEQFYILLPLLFVLRFPSPGAAFKSLWILLFVYSLIFRLTHAGDPGPTYYSTWSSLPGFLFGVLAAYMYTSMKNIKNLLHISSWRKVLWVISLTAIIVSAWIKHLSDIGLALQPFVLGPAMLVIVLLLATYSPANTTKLTPGPDGLPIAKNHFTGSIKKKSIYLGRISYGLYIYHALVMYCIMELLEAYGFADGYNNIYIYLGMAMIAFMATVFLAHISYSLYESGFLKLKSKFQ